VLVAGGGLVWVSLVMLASAVVGFVVITVLMDRRVVHILPRVDRDRWMGLVRAGVPIGLVGVLGTALVKVDQSLISFLSDGGNREVGFYGAAFRLIEATMFIGWSFSAAMLPWFSSESTPKRLGGGFEMGTKATAAVLTPVGLAFVLFAEPIIDLLYGAEYADAIVPLRYLGVMVVLVGINDLAAILLIARERPLAFASAAAGVLVSNIALNFALIPAYGATGAAFTAALSALMLFVLGFLLVRSLTGRVRLGRALAGPTLAGGVGAGVVLFTGLPVIPAAAAGLVAYGAVFIVFERIAFPHDLGAYLQVVRRRSTSPTDSEAVAAATAESGIER
jgi:O-antigen/teichoic acid export membrane protein